MTPSLSLRARLFGPATNLLLKPILLLPAAEMRPRMERLSRLLLRVPRGTKIEPCVLGGVPAERVTPRALTCEMVILYFHGGAYLAGSPATHRGMLAALARDAGCRIVALDYRLAPEHPYPAPIDDAVAAYQALLAEGIPAKRLVLAGDSAGGNLTLVTALRLRELGLPLPARLVTISPWTDMTASGESYTSRPRRDRVLTVTGIANAAKAYSAGADLRAPLLSPSFADLRGLPPLMIQVGDDEILLSDSTSLAEAAQRAGVPVTLEIQPRLWHVWQIYAGWMPEANAALRRIAAFVRGQDLLTP
jgi:acetyl esterase/lipase